MPDSCRRASLGLTASRPRSLKWDGHVGSISSGKSELFLYQGNPASPMPQQSATTAQPEGMKWTWLVECLLVTQDTGFVQNWRRQLIGWRLARSSIVISSPGSALDNIGKRFIFNIITVPIAVDFCLLSNTISPKVSLLRDSCLTVARDKFTSYLVAKLNAVFAMKIKINRFLWSTTLIFKLSAVPPVRDCSLLFALCKYGAGDVGQPSHSVITEGKWINKNTFLGSLGPQ